MVETKTESGDLIFQIFKTELVHRSRFWPEKAVNNSYSRNENRIDLTGLFALFTRFPRAGFGE